MSIKENKIANPLNFYSQPSEVEQDNELTVDDKIKVLTNWLDDIRLRETAEAENMPNIEQSRTYIAEIEHLLHQYEMQQSDDEPQK